MKHATLMKPVIKILSNLMINDPFDKSLDLMEGLEVMLEEAEAMVDGIDILYNPLVLQIEEAGGLSTFLYAEFGTAGELFWRRMVSVIL